MWYLIAMKIRKICTLKLIQINYFRDIMGAKVSEVQPLPEHGVYTVFIELDNTKLELLKPLGENSPIQVSSFTSLKIF